MVNAVRGGVCALLAGVIGFAASSVQADELHRRLNHTDKLYSDKKGVYLHRSDKGHDYGLGLGVVRKKPKQTTPTTATAEQAAPVAQGKKQQESRTLGVHIGDKHEEKGHGGIRSSFR